MTGVQNPVRRDRHQDQRRPRQLQRAAARADAPVRERPVGERAVHAVAQLRQHRRLERSADGRQRRADARRISTTTLGYNTFDVRHTFNFSALYSIPYGRGRAQPAPGSPTRCSADWDVGGIVNARSGLPIDVRITRPRHRLRRRRRQRVQQPGGRPHRGRSTRRTAARLAQRAAAGSRSGVDPFIEDGGLLFLNPAAFATPKPGTYGNLERGSLHGPGFSQIDLVLSKHFPFGSHDAERRVPGRGLQPVRPRQLPESGGDAAERAADQRRRPRRTKCSPARRSPRRSRQLRDVDQHSRPHGRPGTARQVQLAFRLNFRPDQAGGLATAGPTPGRSPMRPQVRGRFP